VAIDYKQWFYISLASDTAEKTSVRAKAKFQPAGHILGSAYVEVDVIGSSNTIDNTLLKNKHRIVFSGDLGAPYAPLLPAPRSHYRADTLVIESTYGDKNHQKRKARSANLQSVIERAVADNGVVLTPAFSIGRTQKLLYELEHIIYRQSSKKGKTTKQNIWHSIEVIVDSPIATNFTDKYLQLKNLWDKEANKRLAHAQHPLDFEQLYTVDSHQEHLSTIDDLTKRAKPAIVIAASGMCSVGEL
jgi:metallo-beta-lactamase family protein